MKKIVVLSGAGISAESGIPTFRDSDGLWEGYNVMDVATPEGFRKNPALVLDFYNQRRKAALEAVPNAGHKALAELERFFDVVVVTQNIDTLHEAAGSSKVIHLHGELFKARSTADESLIYDIDGWQLNIGDCCEKGSQLRPHIVWFGEMAPMLETAIEETMEADIFIVVGTSMVVYPAAGLINYVNSGAPIYIVDPKIPELNLRRPIFKISKKAGEGLSKLKGELIEKYVS